MYVGVKELESSKPIPTEWIEKIRRYLWNSKWAVGVHRKNPKKIAIVLLDMPKVKWYMAGSPITVFMQNSLMEKHYPRLEKALKKHPLPEGSYYIRDLGIDHSQLDGFKGEYDWGRHERKIKAFQKKMDRGDFIDKTGTPCDTCVDEQRFYGCPYCIFNPLADEYDDDDYDGYEEEEGGFL